MKFVVLFEDDPKADPDIRPRHMAAHLAFLERNGAVEAAGPLTDAGGAPAGGLWVVEADTAQAVEDLVHNDPFWPTGLRQGVRILAWTQVFAGGKPRIRPG